MAWKKQLHSKWANNTTMWSSCGETLAAGIWFWLGLGECTDTVLYYRSGSQPPSPVALACGSLWAPSRPGASFLFGSSGAPVILSRGHQNHVSSQWEASWDNTCSVCVPVVFSAFCSLRIDVIVAFLLVIVLLSFELSNTEMNLPAHKSPLQCFGVARWVSPMSPRTKYKWEMQLTGAAFRNAFFSSVPKALYLGSFAV